MATSAGGGVVADAGTGVATEEAAAAAEALIFSQTASKIFESR